MILKLFSCITDTFHGLTQLQRVTRDGRISVAGDPRDIADGESIFFVFFLNAVELLQNVPAVNITLATSR